MVWTAHNLVGQSPTIWWVNGDLGVSADDRAENARRVGEVARLFADVGDVTLVPLIAAATAVVEVLELRVVLGTS